MFENSGTAPLFAAYEYARKYIKVSFSSLESHFSLPRKKIDKSCGTNLPYAKMLSRTSWKSLFVTSISKQAAKSG